MKIKGVIEDLKKIENYNSKNISRSFSGAVAGSVDQFSFRQFLDPAYTSQDLWAPSNVVGTNYRVLICCACHFQSVPSVYFSFFCLLVFSVSNFHKRCIFVPQGNEGGHLFRLTYSVVLCGGSNTANKYHWHVWGVLAVSRPHWVCPRSRRVCTSQV